MTPSPLKILVVDDEEAMQEVLRTRLESSGYSVFVGGSGAEAREKVRQVDPDLIISDVVLPDISGLDLMPSLIEDRHRPVILITGFGTIDAAVEAMKNGAHDFLTKPIDYVKLEQTLERAQATLPSRDGDGNAPGLGELIGQSAPMKALFAELQTVAVRDTAALITGESGTGKELVARTIHALSPRRARPFVALNAAALPEGLTESELFGHEKGAFTGAVSSRPGCFEMANGGTLFLDEIGEMPISLQPKLLRILEESKVRRVGASRTIDVDVRVIAATNRQPGKAIEEGVLRQDLYYRLGVFNLELAPLRERRADLSLLCAHFIQQFNRKHGLAVTGLGPEVLAKLEEYSWPGNVRELRNVMERAVVLAEKGTIGTSHLPTALEEGAHPTEIVLPPGVTAEEAEKIVILRTLETVGNNKAEAARRLGVDVKTIRNRLRSYGIQMPGR
ncbi:MAG: sigma-54 dependent transcriptional regulator [Acidobacteriota bacterium]